jgi:hypothetical protein
MDFILLEVIAAPGTLNRKIEILFKFLCVFSKSGDTQLLDLETVHSFLLALYER